MKLGFLREWMSLIQTNNEEECDENDDTIKAKSFAPEKRLCERDYVILDMLNSTPESVSFCITDPHQPDNPVIHISSGFTKLTGYEFDDIVGRNCRFLQGEKTSPADVKRISDALKSEEECSVNLLNYKKDGTEFVNEFYLTQLRTPNQELAYFIGVQAAVQSEGPGQMPSNPGWVYTLGNHV
ncbi:hypothetical protein ACHAWT_008087 [Skeletonema menzelii]|mmetsp:Transcript_13085/g.21515  ORF Transcript_13085/g.21515 Transcript_13085/m.21515 type:complete len:183 (-) Transcript_13085:203-751(-)|eukprot:scaffold2_cov132-Skeletonema_menzelii.AAC.1